MKQLINPYQNGFLNGRFIGDNGILLHLVLQQSRFCNTEGIGLLLDQEKAYDRVYPSYLIETLRRFKFPTTIITCIHQLFYNNRIKVNVNGNFTNIIHQTRGLRQGDPLSPVLFNLALEPLLLSIQLDETYHGYLSTTLRSTIHIKCIAYADDICVFVKDTQDFYRLQQHLQNYCSVSNAKFNQHKTESFSLNGSRSNEWQQLLLQHNINTYYHKFSTSAFRYLGFYMPYTKQQRDAVLTALLELVRAQIQVYSKRSLSLRGRVTILNTLILSKIWYCLRLCSPTKKFFSSLRSLGYGFIWKKKYPLVAYDQLCLPRVQGGLSLINPSQQYLVLQMKWLFLIFQSSSSSVSYQMLHHHLYFLHHPDAPPYMNLFWKDTRQSDWYHPLSCINGLFKAFDSIEISPNVACLPLQQIIQLPLKSLFDYIPDKHWLHRHPKMTAAYLFTVHLDNSQLRLIPPDSYNTKPRLIQRVYRQIVSQTQVQLNPLIQQRMYLPAPEPVIPDLNYLPNLFLNNPVIQQYQSSKFRLHNYDEAVKYTSTLSHKIFTLFWYTEMPLPARTLAYRTIHHKLPTNMILHAIQKRPTNMCSLCKQHEDTFRHFTAYCPLRYHIWVAVLSCFYPYGYFLPMHIYNALLLKIFPALQDNNLKRFLTVLYTTHWKIWLAYWEMEISHTPFQPDKIISSTITTILRILESSPLLEEN